MRGKREGETEVGGWDGRGRVRREREGWKREGGTERKVKRGKRMKR